MNEKNKKRKFNINTRLLTIIIISGIAYVAESYVFEFFTKKYPSTTNPTASNLIHFSHGFGEPILFFIACTAAVIIVFKFIADIVWGNFLSIPFSDIHKSIDGNLSSIKDKLIAIGDQFDKYLKVKKNPLNLAECSNRDDFCQFIDHAASEIYGKHIRQSDSLYCHVSSRLLNAFSLEPYRTNYKKRIRVDYLQNDDGIVETEFVHWNEVTEFKVHLPEFYIKPESRSYLLDYYTSSYAPGMDPENWNGALDYYIKVNGDYLLSKKDKPIFEKNINDEGFFCWRRDDWINIKFKRRIPLVDEWTEVYIEETSINGVDDKSYSMNTYTPIKNMRLDFRLPKEYAFIKDSFFATRISFYGLPDHIKKTLNLGDLIDVKTDIDNQIFVDIKDWILPGIVLTLDWREISKK